MVELGEYEHYEGGRYEVIANALLESTGEPVVVYKALYDNPKSTFWVRSEADFVAGVDYNGNKIPRFKKV